MEKKQINDSHMVVETIAGPDDALREAERRAQEHYDAWMYAKAETENVRRRSAEEVRAASKFAIERFSRDLLGVRDSLEMGLNLETASAESLKEGIALTLRQLTGAFEKQHLEPIDPKGGLFDAHQHQAVGMVPSDQPEQTVVDVLQKGYTLNGRILRPALVMVAKSANKTSPATTLPEAEDSVVDAQHPAQLI